jgi:hypothetical protein
VQSILFTMNVPDVPPHRANVGLFYQDTMRIIVIILTKLSKSKEVTICIIKPMRFLLTRGRDFIDVVGEVAKCGESVSNCLGYF